MDTFFSARELSELLSYRHSLNIEIHDLLTSTNDAAKELARSGAPLPALIVARRQSAGRGRQGREFHSAAGGLYLSLVFQSLSPPEALSPLTVLAAVAVHDALAATTGAETRAKWPNDILLHGKKLCGILCESTASAGGDDRRVIIGVGVNVYQESFPAELENIAISLKMAGLAPPSPQLLCATVTDSLFSAVSALELGTIGPWLERYAKICSTIGKRVIHMRPGEGRCGTALGIDSSGSLLVKFENDRVEAVSSGEILHFK